MSDARLSKHNAENARLKLEAELNAPIESKEHKTLNRFNKEIRSTGNTLNLAVAQYLDSPILYLSYDKYQRFMELSIEVLTTQSSNAFSSLKEVKTSILEAHPESNKGKNTTNNITKYLKPFDNFTTALEARVMTRLSYVNIKMAKIDYRFFYKKLSAQIKSLRQSPILLEAVSPICDTGEQVLALLDNLVGGPDEFNKEHIEDYIHFLRLSSQALSQESYILLSSDGKIVDAGNRQETKKIITSKQACTEFQTLTTQINKRLAPIEATKLSNFCRAIKEAPWRIVFAMGFAISLAFASPATLGALVACTTIASISAAYKIRSRYCLFNSLPTMDKFNQQVVNRFSAKIR